MAEEIRRASFPACLQTLHVVTYHGKIFFQRPKEGSVQVFVYDNPKAASYGLLQAQKTAPGARVQEMSTAELLPELLHSGVTLLVVNHSIPDSRFYTRDDLVTMVELLGGPVTTPTRPPAAAGSKAAQPVVDPALQPNARPAAARQDVPEPLGRRWALHPSGARQRLGGDAHQM